MKNKLVYLFAVLLCFFAGRVKAQISGTSSICPLETTTLTHPVPGGTWISSDADIATVSAFGVVTGIEGGSVTISYFNGSGYDEFPMTIKDGPTRAISSGTGFSPGYRTCVDATTFVSCAPSGGSWSHTNNTGSISLYSSSTNCYYTGLTEGTATITYGFSSGCNTTATLTVGLPPIVNNKGSDICIGGNTTFTCLTGTSWASGNSAVATIGVTSGLCIGVSPGTSLITFTYFAGCSTTTTVGVSAGSAITGTTSLCVGQTTSLSCSPSGGTWSSANTSVATVGASTGVVTGVAAGTAVISYFPEEGCPSVVVITVSSSPGEIGGTLSVCQGQTTALSCSSGGGTWSSSNTSVATVNSTGVATGVSAGTVTITYNLGGGCIATATLTVNETPAISGPEGVCNGYTITLTGTPGGGSWSSSNTGVATVNSSTGVVTGVSTGTSLITYTLSTGCYATFVVTSGTSVSAISGPSAVCVGQTISLSSSPAGGTWSSSNTTVGTVSTSGVVTGRGFGSTTISYTIGGTCTINKTINVWRNPTLDPAGNEICVGSTIVYDLNGNPVEGGSFSWSSSNTSIATVGTSGIVNRIAAGSATITFTNSKGCYITKSLTIHDYPSISGSLSICLPGTTTLSAVPSGGTWWEASTIISVGLTTGVVTGVATGTAIVTYSLKHNVETCKALATVNVSDCSGKPGIGNEAVMTNLDVSRSNVIPNPNTGTFTLTGQLPCADACNVTVEVTDVLGKTIYSDRASVDKGLLNMKINLGADIANGVYLVRVKNNDISEVIRFTLER